MSKVIALIVAVVAVIAVVFGIFSFKNKKEPEPAITTEQTENAENSESSFVAGGWTIKEAADITLPGDADAAFKKALNGLTGVNYKPIALLGTQVVAGRNYAVLCEATTVTPNPVSSLKVLIIYEALDGSVQITHVSDFNIGDYNNGTVDSAVSAVPTAGGWTVNQEAGISWADESASKAFDDFNATLDSGVTLFPVAALGTQVVAGTNTAYLVRITDNSGNAAWRVAIVYTDLGGQSSVIAAAPLNIGDFNK